MSEWEERRSIGNQNVRMGEMTDYLKREETIESSVCVRIGMMTDSCRWERQL